MLVIALIDASPIRVSSSSHAMEISYDSLSALNLLDHSTSSLISSKSNFVPDPALLSSIISTIVSGMFFRKCPSSVSPYMHTPTRIYIYCLWYGNCERSVFDWLQESVIYLNHEVIRRASAYSPQPCVKTLILRN